MASAALQACSLTSILHKDKVVCAFVYVPCHMAYDFKLLLMQACQAAHYIAPDGTDCDFSSIYTLAMTLRSDIVAVPLCLLAGCLTALVVELSYRPPRLEQSVRTA